MDSAKKTNQCAIKLSKEMATKECDHLFEEIVCSAKIFLERESVIDLDFAGVLRDAQSTGGPHGAEIFTLLRARN